MQLQKKIKRETRRIFRRINHKPRNQMKPEQIRRHLNRWWIRQIKQTRKFGKVWIQKEKDGDYHRHIDKRLWMEGATDQIIVVWGKND